MNFCREVYTIPMSQIWALVVKSKCKLLNRVFTLYDIRQHACIVYLNTVWYSLANCAARLLAIMPKFFHIAEFMMDTSTASPSKNEQSSRIKSPSRPHMSEQQRPTFQELCFPVSSQPGRRSSRSTSRGDMQVPCFRTSNRAHHA